MTAAASLLVAGSARRRWPWVAGAVAVLVAALAVGILAFPWDWLRGPINRIVSESTGRRFEIAEHLDVRLGRTVRIRAEGLSFSNPDWAREPYLVRARAAEVDVRLWPLLHGQIELPVVRLEEPVLGLQMQPDGRKTWALGANTGPGGTVPRIGALVVDHGVVNFVAPAHGADITAKISLSDTAQPADGTPPGGGAPELPLRYEARGVWNHEPFEARGQTGGVLQLGEAVSQPFPLKIDARAGQTRLTAQGTVGQLATLDGLQADFDARGHSLSDLYKLLGVVLPSTPPYALKGRLDKQGAVWRVSGMQGRLGRSDLSGDLAFDRGQAVATLSGRIRSRSLDFKDLAPLVGGKAPSAGAPQAAVARPGRVLPDKVLALDLLKVMNADVRYDIAEIRNVEQLPLQRASARIVLEDGLLRLDPLDLGVAGGEVVGSLRIDSAAQPAVVATRLDARGLRLNQLLPAEALTRSGLGRITGKVDLEGRGRSTAQVLASASGNLALLTGRGEISNLLLEYIGLDGGEIIKFLVGGDHNVRMRCAAAAFDVKQGQVRSRTLVLDTTDTVVRGEGLINLADETLDLRFVPEPKDHSILSFRTPIHIGGRFASPDISPEKGPLALRAGAALALGSINPLLALAATYEPGPGEDANCVQVLAKAGAPLVRPPRAGREATAALAPASAASSPAAGIARVAGGGR